MNGPEATGIPVAFPPSPGSELPFTRPNRNPAPKWEQVEWSKDARDETGEWDFQKVRDTTSMSCASCNHYFEDTYRVRRELNKSGCYVVTGPNAPSENAGFQWNAMCAMIHSSVMQVSTPVCL